MFFSSYLLKCFYIITLKLRIDIKLTWIEQAYVQLSQLIIDCDQETDSLVKYLNGAEALTTLHK